MTLRRDDLNALDALFKLAGRYPGGVEKLAGRLDLSDSMLYKKLENTRPLHFDEFQAVIAMCAAANVVDPYQPLRALNWRFGHVAVKLPDLDDKSSAELAAMVVTVFKEGGDVARVVEHALQTEGISPAEFKQIDQEIEQAIGALAQLREKARTQVQQPSLKMVK